MQLVLTEDQVMLARSAGDFITQSSPITRLRSLRDARDERGYSQKNLKQMAELGFTGIPFSEADGGAGLGLAELCLVSEAMGRTLAPEPLVPAVALTGRLLAHAGSAQQKAAWLAPLIEGDKVLSTAYAAPRSRFDVTRTPFRAERAGAGFKLNGLASHVWGGYQADALVVAARTSGSDGDAHGITLFLLPAGTRGMSEKRLSRIDSLNAALISLEGVEVGNDAVLGTVDQGHAPLARAIDDATAVLCAEMLGGMNEAFAMTRTYLRERRQFGVPIGSFQALKHRAARMFIECELSRSAAMAAARAIDEGLPEASALVSVAKARLSDAYCLVANEAVQMFAGIGMTDEHDIGFYIKRARAAEMTFGDAAYHRARYAALIGY